jgi:uncharacterized damage-inducible protein DinB
MLPPAGYKYLLAGLEGTPDLLDHLLKALPADDPRWDHRPDPQRFTLREVVAHLADWDPIFLERATRMRDEDEPFIKDIDEGQVAIDNDYEHSDPHASLARFRAGRAALIAFLRALPEAARERVGHRELVGSITIEGQAVLILGHDGYHTHQIVQWLKSAA